MSDFEAYFAPDNLDEAADIFSRHAGNVVPVAGGTDVLVRRKRGTLDPSGRVILSLRRVRELRGVDLVVAGGGKKLRVGAAATAREIESNPIVRDYAPVLADAAAHMASAQIRASATVGGNVANASPAADLAVPLLLLDAEVEFVRCAGSSGRLRGTMAVSDFFTGPGRTALGREGIIVCFWIPCAGRDWVFLFRKGGVRPAMECSVVSCGVGLKYRPGGAVGEARVVFGAVAPTPIRAPRIEKILKGAELNDETVAAAVDLVPAQISPIDDVRGSADYRRLLAGALLREVLLRLRGGEGHCQCRS